MRVKLTAKHPRPASSERAPVRTGSTSARKPTRPAGPKPSVATDSGDARGKRAGAAPAGGKRPTGGKPAGAGARAPRAEGSFSRERDAGGAGAARRAPSDRAPRREDGGGAPRRFEGASGRGPRRDDGERAPRRFEGGGERSERAPRRVEGGAERSERAPRRFEGSAERSERAPRRVEGSVERSERAPRRFEGSAERSERAPRRFEGSAERSERAPRRFEGSAERSERAPRRVEGSAGRPPEGRARGERPVRSAASGSTDRPRSGGDRAPRGDTTPRRFENDRGSPEHRERSFAKPVKGAYTDRSDRPARAPRDDRGERAPAKREFGDRAPRSGERAERGERPARGFDRSLPTAPRRFGDDRPARADKPRGTSPAAHTKRDAAAGDAPRTPRRDYEDAPGTLRLSKLMSELGLCSRREADEWIEKGWVLVDGERIDTLGTKVRPDQRIEIDPAAEAAQASQVTVLIHKTVGFVSGQAEDGYQPAITLVTPENRWEGDRSNIRFSVAHLRQLAPAGRLDIDSTGLLVLTQDGRIAKRLVGGHSEIDKEYLVRVAFGEHTTDVESHFPPESLALLRHGLSLDDVPLKPAQVSWQNGEQLRFVLREGKKRQIRRMCELVGLEVIGLKRVRMGHVMLGALPPGQWRYLAADESF
ncbi:pseudouridine synthase [Paraburkholderia xenovorans]|uniref:Dual-specificity RNA pseudouridine synthase RluF n=1 Tax=Paraburkholderia xenovorans (strain LB400) TaxID=266265 RepID=Q13XB2_PARXL|nr:pseudouridine synthase [Paraburkholderia xenovorans]ABE31277.1 Pseudouridine synthase, Rsu [Paraburkholderia xenovorans LB400]